MMLPVAISPLFTIGGLSETASYVIIALVLILVGALIWWAFFKKKSD